MKPGQGFAHRVTLENLAEFAPLLNKAPSAASAKLEENRPMAVTSECFIVANARSDGSLPKPEKMWHDQIFFDYNDAAEFQETCATVSPTATVFRCLISVVEAVNKDSFDAAEAKFAGLPIPPQKV